MEDQQGLADDSHVVNITSLLQELMEELDNDPSLEGQLAGGSPPCPIVIAKVGRLTRNVDESMYDPHRVSIGPYHLISNPDLAMHAEKRRCLGALLSAATGGATALEEYAQELERLEVHARSCYAHSFDKITSREFVRMLLLDGCYMLARFGYVCGGGRRSDHNHADTDMANGHEHGGAAPTPMAARGGDGGRLEAVAVVRDVFYLAENQIPFFVLDKILQITDSDPGASAADRILWYAQAILQTQQYSVAQLPAPPRPGNLLHLLHMHFEPTNPPPSHTDTAGDAGGARRRSTTSSAWPSSRGHSTPAPAAKSGKSST